MGTRAGLGRSGVPVEGPVTEGDQICGRGRGVGRREARGDGVEE